MENLLGKVLASGNGKGNRVIYTEWITGLLVVVIFVISSCFLSHIAQSRSNECRERADRARTFGLGHEERAQEAEESAVMLARLAVFCNWFWIIFVPFVILDTAYQLRGMVRTEITVYENGVIGAGCGGFTNRLRRFQLTYDDIVHTGADDWIFSSAVIIHTPRARYKCYVDNPDAILLAIGSAKFGDRPTITET